MQAERTFIDLHRPAPLVTSDEGARVQKKVYEELTQKLEKIEPGIMSHV